MASKDETLEFLRERKAAYQTAFGAAGAERVLEDLKRFCRAEDSCFHADARIHAVLEGRREVYLRIQHHLNLMPEQLAELFGAIVPAREGELDDD